nr:CAP domain-containing protein [uncultured Noviherbaspirillum sp.]
MKTNLPFLLASVAIALTACGGGGEDSGGTQLLGSSGVSAEAEAEAAAGSQQLSRRKAVTSPAPTPTTAPAPTTTGTQLDARLTCNLPNFQQEILDRVNQARAAGRTCGTKTYGPAPALRWNGVLFNAAGAHSTDMAANNYFSHTSQDGRNPGQRITGAGYAWSAYGENIAAGQTSAQSVVDGWLASPGHCANIMNASYADIGTACVASSTSTYRTYWTMDLARPY